MAIDLRSFTPARVALGRTGHSVPTAELLRFQLDHARARDAVFQELDVASLGVPHVLLRSRARNRAEYLRRPDLGRRLSEESRTLVESGEYDAAIVIADGLSAAAVHHHAIPLLNSLTPRLEAEEWRLTPLTIVLQGRVAIGDEIGALLGARMVVMLIGERPGLTSPDSLGVYITWEPRAPWELPAPRDMLPARTDAERNCISNVRSEGLAYEVAAGKIHFLMREARVRKLSGVALKEDARAELGSL